jgi:hypothetical protein
LSGEVADMMSSFFLMAWALAAIAPKSIEGVAPAHRVASAELIVKLGSRDYRERESATRALDALGGAALEELRKAVHDKDPEVRRRAETLLETIERREESARLLAPRTVHLQLTDAPLPEAVAKLSNLSGFSVKVDESALDRARKQKVTLDTGETTFWKALDELDRKAEFFDSTSAGQSSRFMGRDSNGRHIVIEQRQAMYSGSLRDSGTHLYLHPLDALRASKAPSAPVCYAGALRLRIGPQIQKSKEEVLLPVEVSHQPNVLWEQLVDIRIEKAIDDRGQALMQALPIAETNAAQINRVVMGLGNGMILNAAGGLERLADQNGVIRLKTGEQPSKKLESISGTIIGQMRTPVQTLVCVDNVRKQSGKKFRTSYGESLQITEVNDQADGSVKLRVRLTEPPTTLVIPGNGRIAARGNLVLRGQQVVFNRLGARMDGSLQVDLVAKDSRGRTLPLEPRQQTNISFVGNLITTDVTLTVKPTQNLAPLDKLEWLGQHTATVEVPFTFTDVALP